MKNKLFHCLVIFFSILRLQSIYSEQTTFTAAELFDHKIAIESNQDDEPPFHSRANEKDEDHFMHEFIKMLKTLGVLITVVLIAAWFLKRLMSNKIQQLNTSGLIKVIEQRTVSSKTTIYLLDIQGKGIVFAESANGATPLGAFDVNEKPSSFKDYEKT